MAVEMRAFDRIREKVEIRLDNRQIAWLVVFSLGIAGGVFATGYAMGQRSHPQGAAMATVPAGPTAPVVADVSAPSAAPADPAQAPKYTYDHVLNAASPAAQIEDPTMRLIATAREEVKAEDEAQREAEGRPDLALAGPRPVGALAQADSAFTGDKLPTKTEDAEAEPAVTEVEKQLDAGLPPTPVKPAVVAAPPVPAPEIAESAVSVPKPPATAKAPIPAPERGTKAAAPPTSAKPNGAGFTIQIKSFRDKAEAEGFIGALKEAGYKPYIVAADLPEKGRFFRVRLGKFKTMEEATGKQEAFEKAEGFATIVTPL